MPDTDFTSGLEAFYARRRKVVDIAARIETARESWLPEIGSCVNVTFTIAERDALLDALRSRVSS